MGYQDLEVVEAEPEGSTTQSSSTVPADERQRAFASYRDYIGKDITSLVVLPVWIFQPFTILQCMSEIMEYSELLDKAAATEDPYERLAWVVGFTMGPFGALERPYKPFNSVLGETFEYATPSGTRYLAEQVSHHPPIGAGHGEGELWAYDLVSAPKTKFLGNSVEVYPIGRTRIRLKSTGEVFSLVPPTSKAHNLILGSTWIDTYGDYTLVNVTTGAKAYMYYQPCGWFGSGRYEIKGFIKKDDGTPVYVLEGKWNSHLEAIKCDASGEPVEGAEPLRLWTYAGAAELQGLGLERLKAELQRAGLKCGGDLRQRAERLPLNCTPKPEADPYLFTQFAHKLNSCEGINPLPSDSRRRPDRALLELGRSSDAAVAKYNLEEMQRAEKREREKKGEAFVPRWFRELPPDAEVLSGEYSNEECPQFEFLGKFPDTADPRADVAEVQGTGFNPWYFPQLHPQLGREGERH